MRILARLLLALILLAVVGSAGCAPTAVPEPAPPMEEPTSAAEPTPAPPTPTAAAPGVESPAPTSTPIPPLQVHSSAFDPGGEIPPRHALCPDQENLSPPLSWSNLPPATASLALVCVDSTVGFVHWTMYNIPPTATGLAEGIPPLSELEDGSLQGPTDYGEVGYGGPCPPTGDTHEYVFTLYALDAMLDLPAGAAADSVLQATEGHVLAQAQVSGSYVWQ